jgi:hypothetical protein
MERFVSNILPYVPGCLVVLIKAETLRVATEFCRKTHIWQAVEESTATEGDETITLSPASGDVVGVKVEINDREISDYTLSGTTVTLEDELSEDDSIKVTLYLTPERDATELPDILYNEWLEGISAGVRANLMLMPEKPWSTPNMVMIHAQTYQHQIGQALLQARKKNVREPMRMRLRPWI